MAKQLQMIFLNEDGKQRILKPKTARDNVTAEVVRTAMDKIAELNLFEKDDASIYKEVKSARFVETIVTDLF